MNVTASLCFVCVKSRGAKPPPPPKARDSSHLTTSS
jgi:hypothetical protein